MYKIVELDTLESVIELITEQEYNERSQRYRSNFIYHGLSNSAFKLVTSLQRNCKQLSCELESSILRNFTKYAASSDPSITSSVWKQMILGQHHGLPTRLLDWTYSPLTALHFAVTETNLSKMDKRDCVVWKIDIKEIHKNLPPEYKLALKRENADIFTVEILNSIAGTTEKYDEDMKNGSMVIIEPPSIDERIINQYSYFSITPASIETVENFLAENTENTVKYIIKKELRWRIRDMLDQLNINERTVYPGLDGLSKWLARHYFVQDSK
jgi:hypothetical protein